MNFNQIQRHFAPVLILGLALSGCLFSPDGGTEPPSIEDPIFPVSAPDVLDLLIKSYVAKDIDEYSKLFDETQFTFKFDPTDVEDDPDLDPSWGWDDERSSTRNMFESELVLDVKLDFVKGNTLFARESDKVPLEWRKVICTGVELEVDTIDPKGGENIIYKVAGDRGTYFFEVYAEELIEEQPRWRIVEWRDEKVG